MRTLLTALGVDYDQWKVLTIAALKLDVRTGSFGGARARRGGSGTRTIVAQLIAYVILGGFMALMVWYMGDRFVATTLLYSYVIVMVGTAMLVDHNTAITSPTDYGVLGYQPITSRTYFASKLANALVYTLAQATALGLLPTLAVGVKHGLVAGVAALLALYVSATGVTLAIVAGYASLMRRIGAKRLRSWLSYVQLAISFIVYGGFFMTSEAVSKNALSAFSLTRTPWLMLYPGTWFASYVELATGSTRTMDLIPVLASVGLLAFLVTRLRGRLSLEYAEQIGALTSATDKAGSRSRRLKPGLWFRGGEARAVAILVRSHFRSDLRFRMGVLAILPITVLYLIMGLRGARTGAGMPVRGGNLSMVTMAALLFPMLLKANLGRSDAFRAAWIFFSSPADRTRLIESSKNVLVAFFLVPYLVFVAVLLMFLTHDLPYVVVYLLLVGLMGNAALLIATLIDPEMPFSKPMDKARGSARIILTMVVIGVLGGILPLISRFIYVNVTATVAAFAALMVLTLALSRLTRLRIERQAGHLEFEG